MEGFQLEGYAMTLSAFAWNIVRTYTLTPGRRFSFGCRPAGHGLQLGDVRQRGRQLRTWASPAPSSARPRRVSGARRRQPSQTGSTAGSSMRWRTSKSPAHQPHAPGLHKRTAPATRELCGARRRPGPKVNLALDVLALGAHLDGALQLALKLGAGGRKGLLKKRSCCQ